jgi:hypothetical protein
VKQIQQDDDWYGYAEYPKQNATHDAPSNVVTWQRSADSEGFRGTRADQAEAAWPMLRAKAVAPSIRPTVPGASQLQYGREMDASLKQLAAKTGGEAV